MQTTHLEIDRSSSARDKETDETQARLSMSTSAVVIALLALLAGLSLSVESLHAQATVSDFVGTSVAIEPYPTDPGVMSVRGPNLHIRDWVSTWRDQTDDPRTTGLTTVFVDVINLRPDGSGQLKGTYVTEVGVWEGEEFTETGGVWIGTWQGRAGQPLYLVGHGIAGEVEGLKVHMLFDGPPSGAILAGEILTPGNK